MRVKDVPFTQGLQWVKHGLRLCLAQPLGFTGLLGLMLTLGMLLLMLPIVGIVVIVGCMPLVWLLFMLAARQAEQGFRINPVVLVQHIAQSWQVPPRKKHWVQLGLLYVAATVVVMLLATVLAPDGDALEKAMKQVADNPENVDVTQDSALLLSVLWRIALTWPVTLIFWHTPALLHWGQVAPVKAIFFSAVVCWRNLGAFVTYGLGWVALILALGLPMQLLGSLLGPGILMQILPIALGLWVMSAFYASLDATVSDCLDWDAGPHTSTSQQSTE